MINVHAPPCAGPTRQEARSVQRPAIDFSLPWFLILHEPAKGDKPPQPVLSSEVADLNGMKRDIQPGRQDFFLPALCLGTGPCKPILGSASRTGALVPKVELRATHHRRVGRRLTLSRQPGAGRRRGRRPIQCIVLALFVVRDQLHPFNRMFSLSQFAPDPKTCGLRDWIRDRSRRRLSRYSCWDGDANREGIM